MATNYKILGQSAPSITTDTDVYTVPSATEAIVSTITVCNRGTTDATYRIAVRPDGAALADAYYVAYDATVLSKDTIGITLGLTANAADVFTVYASTADLTFSIFGSEIS